MLIFRAWATCGNNMKDILANIFNRSLESGKYPSKFKMAKVIVIESKLMMTQTQTIIDQSPYYQVLIEFSKNQCTQEWIHL